MRPNEFDDVVDPDIDLGDPLQVAETKPHEWDVLAAIMLGGILGAELRYGLSRAIHAPAGQFPWATFLTNVSGCLLIGALMVVILEVLPPTRLLRPFLGVGVLGGYTTFSTFAVDTAKLVHDHHVGTAVLYLVASVVCCVAAVWAAIATTARLLVNDDGADASEASA